MVKKLTFILSGLVFFWIFTAPVSLPAQQHKPLFTLQSPSKTGVDFINQVEDTKEHNILIYSNYYGGAGVAIADFNNDGLPDICFGGNLVADELYLNQGDFKFLKVTDKAGFRDNGGWSSGVVAADVNNDGWMDLYLTRELYDNQPELRRNQLYINQGASNGGIPTFKESAREWGVDDERRSRHAVFLDYDKDGYLDLLVLNQPPNPGNFSEKYGVKPGPESAPRLYRNLGDRFEDVTQKANVGKPGYPNSVAVTDVDNDGWPDIYVANDFEAPDFLYINNGDGTFRETIHQSTRHISYFSMGVDAADINNDGWNDLMVLDMVAEDNFRLKANMSGMNPSAFWKVVEDGGHFQYMYNSLHLNQGSFQGNPIFGDIAQMASVSSTDWSWSNLIADFDNDGSKDIHVTNGLMRDIRNTDADKKFSEYVEKISYEWIDQNPNAGTVSIWDIIDLDEALKIVPSQKLPNYAFKSNGDLTFTKVAESWGLDQPSFSHGSAYADLDNDGDLDLVVNNVNDPAFVYRNNAESFPDRNYFRVQLTDIDNGQPIYGSKVQISHDNVNQWYEFTNVRGMYSTSENIAHFGVGASQQIDEVRIVWPDGKMNILEDLPANQVIKVDREQSSTIASTTEKDPDFLFTKKAEILATHSENQFDDFEKQVLLPHKMSQFGPALATGDANGDGRDDLYFGGAKDQPGQLLLQNSQGGYDNHPSETLLQDKLYEDVAAAWFDLDGDQDLDLYVVSGGNEWAPESSEYQDRIYINDGNGGLTRSDHDPGIRSSGSCVLPYDYDSDGDTDLFVGGRHIPWDYPTPASSNLLENRDGTLVDVTQSLARDLKKIGLITDGVWTDFDGDGFTDIVLSGEWMPITFLRYDGKKFQDITKRLNTDAGHGWWYSIAAKDIDGDGDQDLVAGNLGLNYKYKASKTEPFEVFYDDFDDSGTKDIVLSYYNFGDRFPLRGRSCSAEQIPDIKYEFPSYEQFASANLTDVYGLNNLNQALHYQASSFASVWLENQGSGKFTTHLLPNEAQLSSINDILIQDFNRDGYQDLLLAGNLFTAEIETTRNDASVGILLLGNKEKEFTPLSSQQSGLKVPFDVKKMALIKSGQYQQVLFGVNDGPLQWFELSGKPSKLITN